jgi:hypothetical protein
MRWTFVWLIAAALGIASNSGCCGCYRGYGTTYAQPAYPAPAYTTPPVVYQPPVVTAPPTAVQMPAATYAPAACSQCIPTCGCQ